MSTRKVTQRGECLHCGRRQKVNKRTGRIGSHWVGGGDTYCPGVDLAPVHGTVRDYTARPKVPEPPFGVPPQPVHAVYKWAIIALLVLLVFVVSYFIGGVIAK